MIPRISIHNGKLGASIPSVNLPPILTCRADAPCKDLCYARHGRFLWKNVKNGLQTNYDVYRTNPEWYFDYISAYLKGSAYRFFRFHCSGDIPDAPYLRGIARVAQENPQVAFLCFTKQYEIVNDYLQNGNLFPDNLHMIFSVWGDYPCNNPFRLPVAYVRLKNSACCIPESAIPCSGSCASCVNTENSCWKLKPGEAVVFDQH